jgi:hypothetical protein
MLSITPEAAIAGRDVAFHLAGLPAWEPVSFTFVDPQGVPVSWITAEDVHVLEQDRSEVTTIRMYPNALGELEWTRYGAQDEEGQWSVDINIGGSILSATYTLESLVLRDFEMVSLGTLLTKHEAPGFNIFYSDLVPTALVADLQEHLSNTASLLERRIESDIGSVPDVYLAGNRELMSLVGTVTGINLGFEDGYYITGGQLPGIFMRTDLQGTEVRRLLTHEYIHHVFDGLANDQVLPAWLTEGLSKYYEFDTALLGPRPDATRLRQLSSADLARAAAESGSLFSLASLDSQTTWNSRTDQEELALQYAQAYMAVRFLIDTYGPLAGKDVVDVIGLGTGVSDALETVTGLGIGVFESQFNSWLERWEDPERAQISDYLLELDTILAAESANSEQRALNIATQMFVSEEINASAALVRSTQELVDALQKLSPPEQALELHQQAEEHLGRVLEWLTLELRAAEAQDNVPLNAANAMIPELGARDFTLKRNMSNLRFIYHLPD